MVKVCCSGIWSYQCEHVFICRLLIMDPEILLELAMHENKVGEPTLFTLHHHYHQFLNREGRLGATDNFATSFLHFPLLSTALWDLPKSKPVHFLMLSSHLFLCLPCLHSPFTLPCKMVLARSDERET